MEIFKDIPLCDIVQYIKDSIDIIVSFKIEEKINEYNSKKCKNMSTDYEELLQKLEADLRAHISYELIFKINYEKLSEKIEELEAENSLLKNQLDKEKRKNNEKIKTMEKEINNYFNI